MGEADFNDGEPSQMPILKIVITLAGVVLILWIVYAVVAWLLFGGWGGSANFGDTFGAINTLFSGLALGGVILAVILQQRELTLQRLELRLNLDFPDQIDFPEHVPSWMARTMIRHPGHVNCPPIHSIAPLS